MPDLSFSSDTLRTATRYVDEAAVCIEVTPSTGDPCSYIYTQRVSKPINDLNDEEAATQDEFRAMRSGMLETFQTFGDMGNTVASPFNASNEG